jgi:hypothetical protein
MFPFPMYGGQAKYERYCAKSFVTRAMAIICMLSALGPIRRGAYAKAALPDLLGHSFIGLGGHQCGGDRPMSRLDTAIMGTLIAALEGNPLAVAFLEEWVSAGRTEPSLKQRQAILRLIKDVEDL